MYVQIITLQAPMGKAQMLRNFISGEYLPAIREASGFISANLLEQVDDRDSAKLIVYWKDQASVENAHSTGLLLGTDSGLVAKVPGLRVQRQSYIMQASAENMGIKR
ncbi:MAG: antibiotic biosynthesis monooxygenase [Phototrophicaceae bacterium]